MNFRDSMNINKDGHLQVGGVDCCDLVKQYGTPLYVMDEGYIRNLARAFKQTVEKTYGSEGGVAFASKAFCCTAIYNIMKQENMCIDVVSGGEVYTALKAGFNLQNAYFHGNNKLDHELVFAIENGIGTIVVDNLYEIEMVENICRALDKTQKVLIRTNPGVEAHTHSFIQTAKIDSKFGFSLRNEETIQAINAINNTTCVKFAGFHCHIGSQIFDKNAFALTVEIVTDYAKLLKDTYNIEVDEMNFGGGFGVHYSGDDPKFSINDYCEYVELLTKTLTLAVEKKNIKKPFFMIEPGRSIVAEAGVTLYSVGAIKEIKGIKKYVNIDGGMGDNIRPALYDAKYDAILANRANDKPEEEVAIAGKCCESADIIISNINLPKAQRGDIVAVFSTGAYCYSMASNYNRNLVPPVVFVNNGKSAYAVKPQSYEDLTRNDVIPDLEV